MRKQTYLLIVTLAASLLLSGCVSVLPGLVEAWFTIAEVETTGPTTPIEETELGPEAAQVAERVRERAAQDHPVDAAAVEIVSVERTEWSDSCLGLGGPAESCAFVITPGYRVVVAVDGAEYAYRTDLTGDAIRAEEEIFMEDEPAVAAVRTQVAQEQGVEAAAVDLISVEQTDWPDACLGMAGPDEMCAQVITPGYRIVVEVDGQQYSYRTDLSGNVIRAEGRSGASWGLALAWHREGGIAGFCNDLTVYVMGIAYATSCAGNEPTDLGQIRLDADQLAQVYDWVDTLMPFEHEQTDPATADAMTIRMVFSGAGDEIATAEQIAEIQEFAGLLYAEIEQE